MTPVSARCAGLLLAVVVQLSKAAPAGNPGGPRSAAASWPGAGRPATVLDAPGRDLPPVPPALRSAGGSEVGAGLSQQTALDGDERAAEAMVMMQMVFYGGSKMQLWFKGFTVDTTVEWVCSCLGLVLFASLYEGLKVGRIIMAERHPPHGHASLGHGLQSFLHLVQVTTSYFLMLAVMTYSSWVMISVCGGAALGYFVFAKFVSTKALLGSNCEHCH